MTSVILASTTTTIAIIAFVVITLGWIVYAIFNVVGGRKEVGSEIELAANRKPYYSDEELEGRKLDRTHATVAAGAVEATLSGRGEEL